jgi:hypothetical protein
VARPCLWMLLMRPFCCGAGPNRLYIFATFVPVSQTVYDAPELAQGESDKRVPELIARDSAPSTTQLTLLDRFGQLREIGHDPACSSRPCR